MEVKLTRVTMNPVDAIEEAASNCYDSEPSGGRIMRACYNSGHHAVLEFAQFTFHITGVSRALLAQLTRHRHASYAVRSQRYCSEDGFGYVIPPSILKDPAAADAYEVFMDYTQQVYSMFQNLDIPNEDARMVLPNACETTLEFSCNGRELIHICNERLCMRAQWEIRQMVLGMVREVKAYDEQCAEFAQFLVPKCEIHKDTPFCTEHSCCGRHPKLKDVYEGYKDPKRKVLENMIQDVKSGILTDADLSAVFRETFC